MWKSFAPGRLECDVVGVAALRTRPVAISKGGGFVEKKQLGVAARLHDPPVSTPEFESAGDPAAYLPVANHPLIRGVQDPTVSHQRAAFGNGNDFAKGRDPILQGHASGSGG